MQGSKNTLYLAIDLVNDAFSPDWKPEAARILREVADKLESGDDEYADWTLYRTLHDANGNDVGRVARKAPPRTLGEAI